MNESSEKSDDSDYGFDDVHKSKRYKQVKDESTVLNVKTVIERSIYGKWLMRLPDVVGAARIILVSLDLGIDSAMEIVYGGKYEKGGYKHLVVMCEYVYYFATMVCIKICNSGYLTNGSYLGALWKNEDKKDFDIRMDPIPLPLYLKQLLTEATKTLERITELRIRVIELLSKEKHANYKSNENNDFAPIELSKVESELGCVQSAFLLLLMSFYTKNQMWTNQRLSRNGLTAKMRTNVHQPDKELSKLIKAIKRTLFKDLSLSTESKNKQYKAKNHSRESKKQYISDITSLLFDYGAGPREFINVASCVDAVGMLSEAGDILMEANRIFEKSNVRSIQVYDMKNQWLSDRAKIALENLNNGKTDDCNSSEKNGNGETNFCNNTAVSISNSEYNSMNRLDGCDEKTNNTLIDSFESKNEKGINCDKPSIGKGKINAYLEALKFRASGKSISDLGAKDYEIGQEYEVHEDIFSRAVTNLTPKRDTGISITKEDDLGYDINDLPDELIMTVPAFPVSGPEGIFHNTKQNGCDTTLAEGGFDKGVINYMDTPFRSPQSLYPLIRSTYYASETPTKNGGKNRKKE
ncbi:hypothetical protein BB559_000778 [Furculomyces boomerangus]|uniref:Uncharacterized protein n=3 Tax=Harpellales TaxID=61421 RepID=A0A2T9Z487_9FUNG|nr:hypothetical protein BB559_000778 [Furculomyces boomerangus]PWA02566.1 hypothetical protein BB558_001279 [Smittium angustum]